MMGAGEDGVGLPALTPDPDHAGRPVAGQGQRVEEEEAARSLEWGAEGVVALVECVAVAGRGLEQVAGGAVDVVLVVGSGVAY